MNDRLSQAAGLLARALKQLEHAHRSLNQARRCAARCCEEKLDQGTSDLLRGVSNVAADLRTLLGIVRARSVEGTTR